MSEAFPGRGSHCGQNTKVLVDCRHPHARDDICRRRCPNSRPDIAADPTAGDASHTGKRMYITGYHRSALRLSGGMVDIVVILQRHARFNNTVATFGPCSHSVDSGRHGTG